jgi:hypothetical protein
MQPLVFIQCVTSYAHVMPAIPPATSKSSPLLRDFNKTRLNNLPFLTKGTQHRLKYVGLFSNLHANYSLK